MSGRKLVSLSLMLLLAFGAISACTAPDKPPLRIGNVMWPGYEPLYLARERGTLSPEDIRLVEYPSATEVIRALRNRSLEAAALTLDEVLVVLDDRIPLKVILIMDFSDGGDVIMARPPITDVQQLRGKRVGVESNALGAYMLTRALQSRGMNIGDVRVQHMDVNTHESAYRNDHIDAAVTFDPVRTRLSNIGALEIFSSRELPGEIVDVLVVHEDVYAARKPTLKRLVDTWFDTLTYLRQQPEDAAEIIAKRLKISRDEVIASYNGITLPDRDENRRLLSGDSPALRPTVLRLSQVLLDNALLRHPVSGAELLSGEIVK